MSFLWIFLCRSSSADLLLRAASDAYIITWWVVCFWFIRESLMRFVLEPLARRAGIKERRAIVRFTEQGYNLCYYCEYSSSCDATDSELTSALVSQPSFGCSDW